MAERAEVAEVVLEAAGELPVALARVVAALVATAPAGELPVALARVVAAVLAVPVPAVALP